MKSSGFTLIELMVVIAIIGLLASVVLASLNDARASARDAIRMQDMRSIHTAFERYKNEYRVYPNVSNGGIPLSGQKIGLGNPIDDVLRPYVDPVPRDPLHDADSSVYFYSYDPSHLSNPTNCGGSTPPGTPMMPVFGFNKAEVKRNLNKDTCHGPDMNLDDADYNFSLQ